MISAEVAAAGGALAAVAALVEVSGAGVTWADVTRRYSRHGGAPAKADRDGHDAAALREATGPSARSATAIFASVGACLGLVLGGAVGALVGGAAGVAAGVWRTRRRADLGRRARERAAPAVARALSDALRGGASVRGALASAAEDRSVPAALRSDLAMLARTVQFGAPLEGSLAALSARGGPGLRLLCGTIALHLDAGGPLARELQQLATDGEIALRIDEDRVAATAQARATVRVVAALPVLALIGAELANTDFLPRIASRPIPLALLLAGFTLEATAFVAARAIVGTR